MWTFQYKHGDRPLEGYTIQRAAGRGGFGEVYYAVSDSGREVALKVVHGYEQIELRGISQCMNLKSPHLVTHLRREAQRPGPAVRHHGIRLRARACGSCSTNRRPAWARRRRRSSSARSAKGLTYLHDCGIVHRDLKPGNIFYENGYVKIGDYGLSQGDQPAASTAARPSPSAPCITWRRRSAAGKYDRSIDIYALGAVLYEMLTGTVAVRRRQRRAKC